MSKIKEFGKNLKDYAKSVWANKATLAGYAIFPLHLTSYYIGQKYDIPVLSHPDYKEFMFYSFLGGVGLLGKTAAGLQTFAYYKRTKQHIENFVRKKDMVNPEFFNLAGEDYCTRQGVKMAIREEPGLEERIEEERRKKHERIFG